MRRRRAIAWMLCAAYALGAGAGGGACEEERKEGARPQPVAVTQIGHISGRRIGDWAFSPDEELLLTAVDGGGVSLWHVETGRELRRFAVRGNGPTGLAWVPSSGRIAIASSEGLSLHAADTGRQIGRLEGFAWSVTASPDGRLLAAVMDTEAGRAITVCRSDTLEPLHRLPAEGHDPMLAFTPDAQHLLAAGVLLRAPDREGEGWKPVAWPQEIGGTVRMAPDGRHLLSWTRGTSSVDVYALPAGVHRRRIEHGAVLQTAIWGPDGRHVLTGGEDFKARHWDLDTGEVVQVLEGHTWYVLSAALPVGGSHAATVSGDGTLRGWDLRSGREIWRYPRGTAAQFATSPSGSHLMLIQEEALAFLDVTTGLEQVRLESLVRSVDHVAVDPGGRWLLAETDGPGAQWDLERGAPVAQVANTAGPGAFSADGRFAITTEIDANRAHLTLWRLPSWSAERRFDLGAGSWARGIPFFDLSAVALSPAGDVIYTAGKKVQSRSAASGAVLREYAYVGEFAAALGLAPDGRSLIVGGGTMTERFLGITLCESGAGTELWSGGMRLQDTSRGSYTAACFSPDGTRYVTGLASGPAELWSRKRETPLWSAGAVEPGAASPGVSAACFSPDGRTIYVASGHDIRILDASHGRETGRLVGHLDGVTGLGLRSGGRVLVSSARDGTVRFWDLPQGNELGRLVLFRDGGWAVLRPDGRFDASDLEGMAGLYWVMPDEPLRALPVEVYMRDYYEPQLLPRLLAAEAFPSLPDVGSLNRVQPAVHIATVEPEAEDPSAARVVVDVQSRQRRLTRKGGGIDLESGAADLRLFRNGRLVAWRDGPLPLKDGKASVVFAGVPLWAEGGGKEVEFSAYAFNTDRVKSPTARHRLALTQALPSRKPATYVIAMGVDAFAQPEWNLAFAASDAKVLLGVLSRQIENVVPTLLVSEQGGSPSRATKASLRATLEDVARKARPQDLVVLAISTHGVSAQGEFYLLPSDVVTRDDKGAWLASCISAEELSTWVRPIDAEIVMIVDACQSAASVEQEGFKPGPMGSRGLGQLAYSKRMRILAASQAAEVALESGQIKHGLLTYALTVDGLAKGRADFDPKDGAIYIGEWLRYGRQRVPTLAGEVHRGEVRAVTGRSGRVRRRVSSPRELTQRPALFDFVRRTTDRRLSSK